MIRNKNKPAKPPKPQIPKTQVGPLAKKKKKTKEKKTTKRLAYKPSQTWNSPQVFHFQIVWKYRSWMKLQQDWDTATGQGGGGGGLKIY